MKIKELLKEHSELWQEIILRNQETQKLRDKASKIRQKLEKYFLENNLFLPIEELKKYDGLDIDEITLITDKKEQRHFSCGDIIKVENGNFYYSDYECGIYEYFEKDKKYHHSFRHNESDGDVIIGFMNLTLGSIWKGKTRIEESFMENILLNEVKQA